MQKAGEKVEDRPAALRDNSKLFSNFFEKSE